MAVLLGNLTLLLDANSPRTGLLDRKIIPQIALDLLLNLPKSKRDSLQINNNAAATTTTLSASLGTNNGFESDKEIGRFRNGVRKKRSNSKVNAVDFDAYSSDEENGNGVEEEEEEEEEEEVKEDFDWEKNMRKRIKELEEMKELEKKAEELQSRMDEEDDLGGFNGGETEEEKRMRVRKELEKVAKEQAERQATAKLMFELGQKAYGRGMYGRATEFLEGALTIIPKPTVFGGEIQIWLAMAYDANNRHADCIDLFRQLENTHPSIMIRRQASEIRYILQAPKLKISKEEMVSIPLIGSSYDSYAGTWTDKKKSQGPAFIGGTTNPISSNRDFLGDFPIWGPPVGWKNNQVFWAALAVTVGLAGAALLQR